MHKNLFINKCLLKCILKIHIQNTKKYLNIQNTFSQKYLEIKTVKYFFRKTILSKKYSKKKDFQNTPKYRCFEYCQTLGIQYIYNSLIHYRVTRNDSNISTIIHRTDYLTKFIKHFLSVITIHVHM